MSYEWDWSVFQKPGAGRAALVAADDPHRSRLDTRARAVLVGYLLPLGTLMGAARTLPQPLIAIPCAAFVEVFRNIPLIVQMFIWYFVAPELLPRSLELAITRMPQPWGQFFARPALPESCTEPRVSPNRCAPASTRWAQVSAAPASRSA